MDQKQLSLLEKSTMHSCREWNFNQKNVRNQKRKRLSFLFRLFLKLSEAERVCSTHWNPLAFLNHEILLEKNLRLLQIRCRLFSNESTEVLRYIPMSSVVSSSSDALSLMKAVQKYVYQFACPLLILLGTISCLFNVMVFTQKALRKNPCSIYFVAYNIANFVYIGSSLLTVTLSIGCNINAIVDNLTFCRLYLYAVILFNCLSPFFLLLASLDRVLITSSNARTRRRSNRSLAYLSITCRTLFWAIFYIHAWIASNIRQLAPQAFLCYFDRGIHLLFVSYFSLIKEALVLVLMILFGSWSVKNIHSVRRARIIPDVSISRTTAGVHVHATSSKDRQLMFMLLVDTSIHALFSSAFRIFLIYQQITQNYIKNAEQMQTENIVRNLCLFSAGIPFCASCYANLVVSETFRYEARRAVLYRRTHRQ